MGRIVVMQVLRGQRALVTGADRGIGAGIATALAEQGASVCHNVLELPKDADQSLGGNEDLVLRADLRDPEQVTRMFREIEQKLCGLNILVNNAGVESIIPALDLSVDEWDRVLDTNLRGAFLCAQSAARRLRALVIEQICLEIPSQMWS